MLHIRTALQRAFFIVPFGLMALVHPFALDATAQDAFLSESPDQLAAAIARTMGATNPATSSTSPIAQQITSHGNIVETRVDFRNAEAFARAKAGRNDLRLGLTRFLCKPDRLPYLHRGVTFRYLDVGPDGTQPFGFVVDEAACMSLASPARSDDATLKMASQAVAQHLRRALATQQTTTGLNVESVTALDAGVLVEYQVHNGAMMDLVAQRPFEVRGTTTGWFCEEAGEAIRRGIRVDVVFKRPDGTPVFRVGVDRSTC